MSIEVEGESSCAEEGEILRAEVPARVRYGTSDGRIKEHTTETTETTLWVYYDKNEELRSSLECHVNDEMVCDGSDDVIDYPLNDCSALNSVTIQIGIHKHEDEFSFSDWGIDVYENHRGGTPIPGAADEVRYFNLGR